MTITAGILLSLLGLIGVGLVIFGLPGIWVLLVGMLLTEWFRPELLGWTSIGVVGGLALLGELVEFLAGAAGSHFAGGSRRAGVGAIVGGIVGAIAGTPVFPVIGTIVGGAVGAGVGAAVFEMSHPGLPELPVGDDSMTAEPTEPTEPGAPADPDAAAPGQTPLKRTRSRQSHVTRVAIGAATGRFIAICVKTAIACLAAGVVIVAVIF